MFEADRHSAAIAKRDGAFFFVCVFQFDDASELTLLVLNESSIGCRVSGEKSKNGNRRFRCAGLYHF